MSLDKEISVLKSILKAALHHLRWLIHRHPHDHGLTTLQEHLTDLTDAIVTRDDAGNE